jgi:hypothetical protein
VTPDQEQKVLDAAAVVTQVFPQFDRRLELVEGQMERTANQIDVLHGRVTTANKKIDESVEDLNGTIGELNKQIGLINGEMTEQTSILRKWEEAQKIIADATASSIVTAQNGHESREQDRRNAREVEDRHAREDKQSQQDRRDLEDVQDRGDRRDTEARADGGVTAVEKKELIKAISTIILATWNALVKTPRRIVTTSLLAAVLGSGGFMAYFKGCVPVAALIATPTATPTQHAHHNHRFSEMTSE